MSVDTSSFVGALLVAFKLTVCTVLGMLAIQAMTGDSAASFAVGLVVSSVLLAAGGDRTAAYTVIVVPLGYLLTAALSERMIERGPLVYAVDDPTVVFVFALGGAWLLAGVSARLPEAIGWGVAVLGGGAVAASLVLWLVLPHAHDVVADDAPIAVVPMRLADLPPEETPLEFPHEGVTLRVFRHPGTTGGSLWETGFIGMVWDTGAGGPRGSVNGYAEVSFHVSQGRLVVFGKRDGRRAFHTLRSWPDNQELFVLRGDLGVWAPPASSLIAAAFLMLTAFLALLRSRRLRARSIELDKAVAGTLLDGGLVELHDGTQHSVSRPDAEPGPVGVLLDREEMPSVYREPAPASARIICGDLHAERDKVHRAARASIAMAISAGLTTTWLCAAASLL